MERLFSLMDFKSYADGILKEISDKIQIVDREEFKKKKINEFTEELFNKHKQEIPVFKKSEIYQKVPKEIPYATEFEIIIPFIGTAWLFSIQPTSYRPMKPLGIIDRYKNQIQLIYTKTQSTTAEYIQKNVEENLNLLKEYLERLEPDVNNFNSTLKKFIEGEVKTKDKRVKDDDNTASLLNVPIKYI